MAIQDCKTAKCFAAWVAIFRISENSVSNILCQPISLLLSRVIDYFSLKSWPNSNENPIDCFILIKGRQNKAQPE